MILGSHPIGVCSWSFNPKTASEFITGTRTLGLQHIQLGLAHFLALDEARRTRELDELRSSALKITAGMISFPGEDYSTIPSIRKTGGLVPDDLWPQRKQLCDTAAKLGNQLGIKLITTHIGFVPAKSQPHYDAMVSRTREVADLFAKLDIALGLETGQETADDLLKFLDEVDRKNVVVNFDPANMILYGAGDPIEAIRKLGSYIRHVHIKDAAASDKPGEQWGKEKPVGEGQVNLPAFINALHQVGYNGPLVIEREAGHDREGDARSAIETLSKLLSVTPQ